MLLSSRRVWVRQPQIAVTLDQSNALARKFDVFCNFAPTLLRSAAPRPVTPTFDGMDGYRAGTPGVGIYSAGSGGGTVRFTAADGDYNSTTGGSFFHALQFTIDALGTAGNGPVLVFKGLYGSTGYFIQVSGVNVGDVLLASGFDLTRTNGGVLAAGGTYTVVITGTIGVNNTKIYINGAEQALATSAAHSPFGNSTPLDLMGYNRSTAYLNGSLYWYGTGRHLLTAQDAALLHGTPWRLLTPMPRRIWAPSAGSPDVTLPLTGTTATASAGTTAATLSKALSGQASTTSAGTVTPTVAITAALSGQTATASAGATAATISKALSGSAVTSATGTLNAGSDVAQALSGSVATASTGTVAPTTTVALSGSSSTSSAGTITPTTDPTASLSGSAATASTGSVGVAVSGSVALSGQAATVSAGTTAATLSKALSGQAATTSAGTTTASILAALSGSSATASAGTLVGSGGTITQALSGQALTVSAGTIAANSTGPILVALTGSSAIMSAGTLIGIGGTFVWTPIDDSQTPDWTPVVDTQSAVWTPVAH